MKIHSTKTLLLLLALLPFLHGCLLAVAGGAAVGADVVHDRRDTSTVIGDRRIALNASDAINRDRDFVANDNYVKTIVYNGVVLLCGQVRSEDLKQRAQSKVKNLDGVQRVVNELDITDEPQGFWRRREDNAMTARVKTALLDITSLPGFDPLRVNVTVVHGTAFLMGMVNHEEADAVVDIARNVGGIDKVVKVFEYTD
ncbi:MAG TPA: BON domain-containing protein [Rudaea sp.]|jgi:osmotically-inducible protein OsmY|uniref:BON domain-containing protein n=1 Tax=Rudaea sp. TaxID=2136325 RepID=UPI002F92ABAE